MDAKIIKKRIRTIRHQLKKKRIKSLLVTKPANVTYVTGFSGDDGWVLITDRVVYLLTDNRYTEQAGIECPLCNIIERNKSMVDVLAELAKKLKLSRAMTVENSVSLAVLEKLKAKVSGRIGTVSGIVEELRSSKDDSEIAAVKKAAQIAAKALRKALKYVRTNITENELAGALDFEIRKAGAKNSFDIIVAFGPNASRPHHQPASRKLKKNDTVLIDFGVKFKGYCCDITRCFAVGRPEPFYKKVLAAVREAQSAAIKMVRPGVAAKKVDAAAREVIRKHGLPVYGHGTGHGLGLEVHESPAISPNSKAKLRPGMVLTIEPAVYIPRKLGVRIEDDCLVTKTGCRVLTRL